jgi:hypothetical protein
MSPGVTAKRSGAGGADDDDGTGIAAEGQHAAAEIAKQLHQRAVLRREPARVGEQRRLVTDPDHAFVEHALLRRLGNAQNQLIGQCRAAPGGSAAGGHGGRTQARKELAATDHRRA